MSHGAASVAILMYHSFTPTSRSSGLRHLSVEPAAFEEHVAALLGGGFALVAVRDVPAAIRANGVEQRIAAISIDDGLADGLAAAEILARYDAPATFFIPTAFVGGRARWLDGADAERAMFSWDALAGISSAGLEVASHGHGHIAADVNPARIVSADALRSRSELEDHLGVPVSSYAYPFGYQRAAARRAVQAAGFSRACAIFDLPASSHSDPFALPRLQVGPELTAQDIVSVALSRPRWPARFESHQRQRAWTTARRFVRLGPEAARPLSRSARRSFSSGDGSPSASAP